MRNRIPRVRVKINAPECENSHYSLIEVYPHAFIIEGLCCTITAIGKHRERGAYFFPCQPFKNNKNENEYTYSKRDAWYHFFLRGTTVPLFFQTLYIKRILS